jgi:hypothetical protein
MKLTQKNVVEFNRRARIGVKPSHPGWEFIDGPLTVYWRLRFPCTDSISVTKRGDQWIINGLGLIADDDLAFDSATAAQLAVEYILLEWADPIYKHLVDEAEGKRDDIQSDLDDAEEAIHGLKARARELESEIKSNVFSAGALEAMEQDAYTAQLTGDDPMEVVARFFQKRGLPWRLK